MDAVALWMRLLPLTLVFLLACASTTTTTTTPTTTAPAAPPAERNVLADLPHERVDYWVERFTKGDKRAEIAEAFVRKPQVDAMIAEKLRRRGMPEELVYLAMAESGFNPQAHSASDAVGIWQLVPDTARRWGLKVDDTVDERRDPEKSTDAALSYLSYLYNRFGSWYLAAAAYNAGENRVSRIMSEATGKESGSDADYYRVWDQLPGETRDYVPAMVALARIGRDRVQYGF
jgi:membrane-bound lytic murein transglycosylase D